MSTINVRKRNGSLEVLDYDKIHTVLSWATEGLKKVSISDIEMNAKLQIKNGISTDEIHRVLITSAADLISPKNHNYQYVAARLSLYYIRKEIFGVVKDLPDLSEVIKKNVEIGVYDPIILEKYSEEDLDIINDMIKHERDFKFAFAGLQQLIDKYLLKDRTTGQIFESPQYMYIMIAMTLFSDYKKGHRLNSIRKFYNDVSQFKLSLPTPIMCGVRTPNRQYSSCTLIDVGDSLDSIFSSDMAVGKYTSKRAGIGLNMGRIRSLGSKIRDGEVVHTGVIPFLKKLESTTKCCTQNGVRGGSSTTHFPFWHKEIESVIVLKNNRGTDDNRVRKMDYSIQLSRIFYRRFRDNEDITLFNPGEVPGLMTAFAGPAEGFEELYLKYEKDKSIKDKKVISAREFFNQLCRERLETGRIYIMNMDHVNTHTSFEDKVYMSNLCLTGDSTVKVKINGDDLDMTLDTLHGLAVSIQDEEDHGTVEVLSRNIETNQDEFQAVKMTMLTAEDAKGLYEITDEVTGKSITCTGDHKVFTQRGYVPACELVEEDTLTLI